ncbi:MAG: cofactor-independent phosphoglycerate mutase [Omnitrophica WOR_2 bacterium RIFCSPLOWO2_12_FULL_51_24]|nr:MAG: cofactor-independent phosphoglycerate mutase [Omnitrophica WOR_2 bacterium RIFCSPHIGHO2_01_FULL_49_10]OGX33690.1 MAG: cofactor-independent phosphoglycerate mutase [Omnitrophica WOR_2 bacterium RIFCSPLOWO2_02_FULL_50_19]OGX41599.1 MAG: cofactor-independent phosphoglycerate mutase [Omnitrophica WOR_2 bacterium RIFCSPLOWO2_12_FULL_51_24]
MKYIVLVGDGMADYPIKELGNKTPLEAAKIPNMNYIAKNGRAGLTYTIPKGFAPASDVANLSIIGYDPAKYYSGRGPLEAANMGIKLGSDDIAFRCNLVTVDREKMADYSAGHITSEEAATLIRYLDKKLGSDKVKFYPGVSYRHLIIVRDGSLKEALRTAECVPPHDITGMMIKDFLPKGAGAEFLIKLMEDSRALLSSHEVNHVRIDLKENPADMIWLWGQGVETNMPTFKEKFGVDGSVISAVDLIKGIGKSIGLNVINVPGATGYYDTNYKGKAKYAIDSLKDRDFVFVHVEAPDEAGHNGDLRAKIAAIENFDRLVVGTVLEKFKKQKDFRIMVLPDHSTPVSVRTHTAEPVPFAVFGKGVEPNKAEAYNEVAAKATGLAFEHGHELMEYFIKK